MMFLFMVIAVRFCRVYGVEMRTIAIVFALSLAVAMACGGNSGKSESTLGQCTDGVDNDGNGLPDCDDPQCQVFVACVDHRGSGDALLPDGASGDKDQTSGSDTANPSDGTVASDSDGTSSLGDGSATDAATPSDHTVNPGGCDPCGYGSIKGQVCAPNQQVFVSGAQITIETTNCNGEPLVLTAISKFDGTYFFENVPCGDQTIHIQKGSFVHDITIPVKVGQLMDISGTDIKMCFGAKVVNIAVFWGQWDAMNDIVNRLGFDYDWYYFKDDLYAEEPDWPNVEAVKLLLDPEWLAQYNILIFNCGSAYLKWVDEFPDIQENVRDWVLMGGSLYMSDLAWIIGEKAFPDAIDFYGTDDKGSMAPDGPQIIDGQQDFDAFFVDAELAAYVGGAEITVHYDAGPLISVAGPGVGTKVHAKAHIEQCTSFLDSCLSNVKLDEDQPVILSYQPGPASGNVVYSCFHVDEQNDQEKYDQVLYYMLFML